MIPASHALRNNGPYLLAFFAALVMGVTAATSQPIVSVLFAGALASLFLISQPVPLLWATLVITLVIAGVLQYFVPTLDKVWWAAYGMGAMLFAPAIMAKILNKDRQPALSLSPTLLAMILFVLIALFTTLINRSPVWQVVLAMKSLFMLAGVWAALAILPISKDVMRRWLLGFVVIGLIQWLPVIYQYLFIRPNRLSRGLGTIEASDSVVGTFGGSMESGGLTAVLAAYLVMLIIFMLAYYRNHLIKRGTLLLCLLFLGVPLLLIEAKVIFVYLPVCLFILYKDVIRRRPFGFIVGTLAVITLLGSVILAYQTLHWSASGRSLADNVKALSSYSFEKQLGPAAREAGIMTRREALDFWWDIHSIKDPVKMFMGHGLGASRTQGLGTGNMAAQYFPRQIDLTGLTSLLWDTGILGTAAFLMILIAAYRMAGKLAASPHSGPWENSLARGLQACTPIFLISLFYRADIPYTASTIFLFMVMLGLIDWLRRQEAMPSSHTNI